MHETPPGTHATRDPSLNRVVAQIGKSPPILDFVSGLPGVLKFNPDTTRVSSYTKDGAMFEAKR